MTDWAQNEAVLLLWEVTDYSENYENSTKALIEVAAALRKAKADGWREAGNYVVGMAGESENEIERAAFLEAGFELIGEADKLEHPEGQGQ